MVFAAARDNEYLYVCLRCVMNPTSETSFRTDVACRYYFWFDHDKLVELFHDPNGDVLWENDVERW